MEEGILLPKIPNDCDDVYDKGKAAMGLKIKALLNKGHHIIEAHETGEQGWCEMICVRTGKIFRHIIKCPNTFALKCRGCNKTVY